MGRRVNFDLELSKFLKKPNFEGALQENNTCSHADFFYNCSVSESL